MTRDERLQRCERLIVRALKQNDRLSERITELEVQSRFVMSCLKMKKPGTTAGLLDADNRPVIEIIDGWAAYTHFGGREKTLELLQEEFIELRLLDAVQEKIKNGDTRPYEEIRSECEAIFNAARQEAEAANQSDGRRDLESEHVDVSPGTAH